jgi:hemerythrin superfamily protein
MDAITNLTADHNRVRGLFTRWKDAHEKDDAGTMGTLASEIFQELEVHTTIEEQVFYPWAREKSSELAETINEGVQEHHVVKVLMQELQQLDAGADAWTAKMTVLIENVEHHAEEEETELFPKVRSNSTGDERTQLSDKLEAKKRELGAPVLADKIDLTTEELHRLATAQAIPGRSKMDHDELAATVSPS